MGVESKDTRFGTVYRLVGGCKDDWKNIDTMKRYRKPSGRTHFRRRDVDISGQRPMLAAIRQAEIRYGAEIKVTGSLRTCAYQADLYRRDPNRYAPPSVGLHCQGLAIDVNTNMLSDRVREALEHVGFTQARPSDEPWHFSFGFTA